MQQNDGETNNQGFIHDFITAGSVIKNRGGVTHGLTYLHTYLNAAVLYRPIPIVHPQI